jgi:hypothetical protein
MKHQELRKQVATQRARTDNALVSHPRERQIPPPCRRNQRAFNGA